MAEKAQVELDQAQVKKAVQALQAFLKTQTKPNRQPLLSDDHQQFGLLFTLWRIPRRSQTIRIPLPHKHRSETDDICLFTRDEPQMTPEQTQRFYKRLLEEKGVSSITEIIPYKALKTEYKPFEAKRRLLGNFDMFLSDDRIRRLLPSHLGKHFYERKKEPLCVNLQSKNLARDIQRLVQGTNLKVTKKGCCCMARIGHSGMTADEVTENIEAAVKTVMEKIRMDGSVMKVIHLKSQESVALPIYNSELSHLYEPTKKKPKTSSGEATEAKEEVKDEKADVKTKQEKQEEEEEDIPQLVPIATPVKKPKLKKSSKKQPLEKASRAPVRKQASKTTNKLTKKASKMDSKVRRKVPKVK
ncbi:hypothetical protein fugu_001137 [Takifugu bimaculatus]|uniref:Ribosomal L1 domain-containing protein 1 n=1 Tax=Takifugu bimaculatus TaxID=433685 RepID=A0A4Z2CIS4_9TELE|nr:hypothetical protein fugu_001137 [Takifugu bimaculatus]